MRYTTRKSSKLETMKYLGALREVLIILGLGVSVGLGLAYCQKVFKWNPEYVQLTLVVVGIAISLWACFVYTKFIKEWTESLDDWD